jgi:hypothetical protein
VSDIADENGLDTPDEKSESRRKFLMLGGGAAATAAALVSPDAASAVDGQSVVIGNSNTGGHSTSLTLTNVAASTFVGVNNGSTQFGVGVEGSALLGTGVYGVGSAPSSTQSAIGVHAAAAGSPGAVGALIENEVGGVALKVSASSGPLALLAQSAPPSSIPPTSGTWSAGTVLMKNGHLYYCYAGGVGTASKWSKVSGGLILLPAAKRTYVSATSDGSLSGGQTRTVSLVVSGGLPAGASGVLMTLTATGTLSAGSLAVFATGATYGGTTNLSWFGSNETISNSVTSAVNASGHVNVRCSGCSTQFVIDVVGFYP